MSQSESIKNLAAALSSAPKLVTFAVCLILSGCGYSARNNEMIGQIKKVVHNTPLICPDYDDADISLGVLRGGVGSMSSQDIWIYVPDKANYETLKKANESGALVKVGYSERRLTFCVPDHWVDSVEIVK